MTSFYNINSTNCFVPSGSVLAFIGSTTTDPPGWVIADGVARTTSDIYNNLVNNLSIGSRDSNQIYTPPNLQGAFLRGTGTSDISNSYAGTNLLTQQSHAIKTHLHPAEQAAHSHETNPPSTGGAGTIASPSYGLAKCVGQNNYPSYNVTEDSGSNTDNYDLNIDYYAGLVINNVTTIPTITVYENTNNESNTTETRPFSYGVFWIIKL